MDGYKIIKLDNDDMSLFYEKKLEIMPQLEENQYLLVQNNSGEVVDYYVQRDGELKPVAFSVIDNSYMGTIKPRNPEQMLAFHLLKDDRSTIKVLTGKFGTGKTFLLIAAALDAIAKGKFEHIMWVRNNIQVKDTDPIGALPGTEFDKLLPYCGPLLDHIGGEQGLQLLLSNGVLSVQHLGFIRGRDIKNTIVLCSECENMTKEHLQLLIGRIGEGSNLWLDGDWKQRDKAVFTQSRGLELMIERLSGNPLFGYVNLKKSERSQTAALADLLD